MKKKNMFLLGLLVVLLAMGMVLAGCGDDGTDGYDGDDNSGGNQQGGNNTGGNNTGGNNNGGNNNGDNNNGDNNQPTFTPPKKADIEAFVESYRTTTTLMGENAAVYIKSIAVNTYTVDGKSITSSPSPVPENAKVEVKITVRTNLSSANLNMGEKMNIDNFRGDVQSALRTWLKDQGFGITNITVTTGDTIFG